jgi:mannose-6-phosphate isomerase-like protein (cupin superfamily)
LILCEVTFGTLSLPVENIVGVGHAPGSGSFYQICVNQRRKAFMNESLHTPASIPPTLRVPAGEDRFGEYRGLGISSIAFKVSSQDSGGLFILENTFREKGGPARHLHYEQDEWFYAVEGEFIFEVGPERFRLKPGDSLLAPCQVPHVWAYIGNAHGRILIAFTPAGKMEAFFREVTKANAMPPQDPEVWRAYGMQLLGPPLSIG